jgi:cellulose synthase/poly-beta-1,6-N-acetylglucosamine synthase-like glycosyltransferase
VATVPVYSGKTACSLQGYGNDLSCEIVWRDWFYIRNEGGLGIKARKHKRFSEETGKENRIGARVVALVPAHNEEKGIRATIESLLLQTHLGVDVLVVSDNSTDNTVAIVRDMAAKESRIMFMETQGNKYRKAGALNAAYRKLGGGINKYDFVLVLDADTLIAPDLVEQGLVEFSLDLRLGSVCSRAGVMRQQADSLLAKLLYYQQHVEYAEFDRSRIVQHRRIKVTHGMCAMFKTEAVKAVMARRIEQGKLDCLPYDQYNITEDYELTVTLKECGFNVAVGFGMLAWTEVPLQLSQLWKQRIRWLRGGLDTLWQHGWNSTTRGDILNAWFFWVMLMIQGILVGYALLDVWLGVFSFSRMVLLVMTLMYVDCIYSLRFVQDLNRWDYFVRVTFLPQILYAWFTIAQQLYAYYLFLSKSDQEW